MKLEYAITLLGNRMPAVVRLLYTFLLAQEKLIRLKCNIAVRFDETAQVIPVWIWRSNNKSQMER
jgi:hypothetical protein